MKRFLLKCPIITICIIFFTVAVSAQPPLLRDIQDGAITLQIKTMLAANPVTKSTQIHVVTHHGYVSLSGALDSKAEANTAKQIARSVQGVKGVSVRDISIKHSKRAGQDYAITQDIRQQLNAANLNNNPRFPDLYINVETRNRNVYLTGNIIYSYQGSHAVEIARETPGVEQVYYRFNTQK